MTHSTSPDSSYFAGIDVARAKLDLARSDTGEILTVSNDAQGIGRIVDSLRPAHADGKASAVKMIVIESTGGLERPLLDALLEANLPVALVNPRNVRQFAAGIGILAKTDSIDARVLAEFAQLASPRLAEKRSENQVELDALITCRRQTTQLKSIQLNRRAATSSKTAIKSIDAILTRISRMALDSTYNELSFDRVNAGFS